jgi:xylulose-5-phosphate/fructose-6-phosphate phosphoketolase
VKTADTHDLGKYLSEVVKLNEEQRNFRIFGPDETLSNGRMRIRRHESSIGKPKRKRMTNSLPGWSGHGVLSEHLCEGWLEGYFLTGRHASLTARRVHHIIDSMFNQHAKWLKVSAELPGEGRSHP